MPRERSFDHLLLFIILALMGLGLVMVYSSSALVAEIRYQVPSYYFFKKQVTYVGLAIVVLISSMIIPYKWWRKLCYIMLILSVALLLLVFFPALGKRAGGASRWVNLPWFSFQPGEFAKLALMVYLAHFLTKKADRMEDMKAIFLPLCIVIGLSCLLLIKQPDFGTAVLIVLIALSLIFIAGAKKKHLFGVALIFMLCLSALIWLTRYQWHRLLIFNDPWKDSSGAGYQIVQSFCALGAGGWFGLGLGQGIEKRGYLPEAHTDFIFSVIGEEMGLMGTLIVLALFGLFIWRGFRVTRQVEDPFARHLALGVTCLIGCQGLINMAVVVGLLPTKGLPLPFVSFGGSSMIISALAAGMLLNISQDASR